MDLRRWTALLALLFLFGLFFRVEWVISLAISVVVVLGMAYWWRTQSLRGVEYRRDFHFTRGFPGEETEVRIEVENRKLLPISWLRVQDPWPKAVAPRSESTLAPSHLPEQGVLTNLFSLRWYEKARRKYPILFRKRGVYGVGPAQLISGDIFGIYEVTQSYGKTDVLTVFPKLEPLPFPDLPVVDPMGDRRSQRRLFEDPNRPMGVREYHPEDSIRRVHWPATAHTGKLQVKVYQPTSGQVMVVCLNVSTFDRHWEGVDPVMLEYLVSTAATFVSKGLGNGYRVGLAANGCITRSDQPFRIPPGRSPKQQGTLLSALAGVNPVVTAQFERFLLRELPRIPYGATVVVITAVVTKELEETLLLAKKHERKLTLVSLADTPPEYIPGVTVHHLPRSRPDSGTKNKTESKAG